MPAYQLIAIGLTTGIIITLCGLALFSKKSDPDPDRREYGRERRKRHNTRMETQIIADHYSGGALTLPQAVNRLREIEAPASALDRCACPSQIDWNHERSLLRGD